ncbi:MAG: hypothetical protein ACREI9_12720 [Nitrospiraceae bacterium]
MTEHKPVKLAELLELHARNDSEDMTTKPETLLELMERLDWHYRQLTDDDMDVLIAAIRDDWPRIRDSVREMHELLREIRFEERGRNGEAEQLLARLDQEPKP